MQDSFTLSYNAKGRHDLKAGGEFLLHHEMSANCTNCMGNIDARGGAISSLRPSIEEIFPDAFNVDTWNLAAISPLVRTYRLGVHKGRRDDVDLRAGDLACAVDALGRGGIEFAAGMFGDDENLGH